MGDVPKLDGWEWRPGAGPGRWILFRASDEIMMAHVWTADTHYKGLYNAGTPTAERWRGVEGDSLEDMHRKITTALIEAELEGVARG